MEPPPPASPITPEPAAWSVRDAGFILGADRLAGVHFWKATTTLPDGQGEVEASGTQTNFLAGNSATGDGDDGLNPSAMPRVTFDFVVGGGLTLGGALGAISTSGEEEYPYGETTETDEYVNNTGFLFAPRIGYLIPTSQTLTIWLKGGITFFGVTSEAQSPDNDKLSYSGTQLSLDPALMFTPVEHVGILVEPIIDVGLSGGWEYEPDSGSTVSEDFKYSSYGIAAGLVLLF